VHHKSIKHQMMWFHAAAGCSAHQPSINLLKYPKETIDSCSDLMQIIDSSKAMPKCARGLPELQQYKAGTHSQNCLSFLY